MSNFTIRGNQLTALEEAVESTVDIDEENKAVARVTYNTEWANAVALSLAISSHPDFSGLLRKEVNITRMPGLRAKVVLRFEGIIFESDGDNEDDPKKTYSVDGVTGTEPIETHRDFKDFGGEPVKGKKGTNDKGATFDETGKFTGFAVASEENQYYGDEPGDSLAGTRSYLAPGATYTETATYSEETRGSAEISLRNLGRIDDPPESDLLPETSPDQNWLLVGYVASDVGTGLQVKRKWRASGIHGWNETIYKKS